MTESSMVRSVDWTFIAGGITAPAGFQAAGIAVV